MVRAEKLASFTEGQGHTRSSKKAGALFNEVWMDDFLDKPRRRVNFGSHKNIQKF